MGIVDVDLGTVLSSAGGFLKSLREAITGKAILDPNKQAELLLRAQEIENGIVLGGMAYEKAQLEGQLAINKAEAESPSLFKGGWRPYVGWVCGMGLTYDILVRPILPWLVQVGAIIVGKVAVIPPMPPIDTVQLIGVLSGLLGIGAQRMMEKKWGVASK